ncbi:helix-turn-helix domain-containing protein [Polaribacter porphyrae]|uniref:HTH araC/xylS-type domain-containing protein n=1 Tax=Polaribacter porphyrae TaxID=1137780 RepID=A0A2S7WM78_9FLAO|nr:helix-turn-helix domain-containing protein [Polaribacter porphyrae]PQJ78683.1 hypothetical protein BTO18_05555 [Polaribacter porphyrae]
MEFKYYTEKDKNKLINKLFKLSFSEDDLPLKTTILPIGYPTIAYLFGDEQISVYNNVTRKLKKLIFTGQHYGAYDYFVNDDGLTYGIELHPTAFYKILNTDVSILTNQHFRGDLLDEKFSKNIEDIFLECKNDETYYIKTIIHFFNNLDLTIDDDVVQIDNAIDLIFKKEGMLQINDLLRELPYSQKTLETKFKKIVGLTPGRYMKLIRFSALMRKYEGNEINLNHLIYKYAYYDQSHFIKDFKIFFGKSPKSYFKKDFPIIEKYLKD